MISAHDPIDASGSATPPTNKVIKVLSLYGNQYKTFGENIILLINREGTQTQVKLVVCVYMINSSILFFKFNSRNVIAAFDT